MIQKGLFKLIALFCLVTTLYSNSSSIRIELSHALRWYALQDRTYQLESSTNGNIWNPIGPSYSGNNDQKTYVLDGLDTALEFRLLETIHGNNVSEINISNASEIITSSLLNELTTLTIGLTLFKEDML